MSLCIGGVCIPYSTLIPLVLLAVKPLYEFILKLFGYQPQKPHKKNKAVDTEQNSSIDSKLKNIPIDHGKVYDLSKSKDYESEFEAIITGKKTVVRFTATWCKPCKRIEPLFIELAEKNPDVVYVTVDVDKNESIATEYEAYKIPMFLVFKNGEKVGSLVGDERDKLTELVNL